MIRVAFEHSVPPVEAEAFERAWHRCKLHTIARASGMVEAVLLRSGTSPGEFLCLTTWEREEDWRAYWARGVVDPEGDAQRNERWIEVRSVRKRSRSEGLQERSVDVIATDEVLYTARTHTTGGRDGNARSDDGRLETRLSSPGSRAPGTNPEQLFAAGWSACFIGAMQHVAGSRKIHLTDPAVDAEVDLRKGDGGYSLAARLHVRLPGLDPEVARSIVDAAHETCPYSKATRGNIDVHVDVTV